MKPRVCILRTDGTNCDRETAYAFERCGALPEQVHINALLAGEEGLEDYQILVLPGGAAYGDGAHAGKIWAVELIARLREQLSDFVARNKLVLGIGNGFQVLVRAGFLPAVRAGRMSVTLTANEHGRFECRWVRLRVGKTPCVFTAGMESRIVSYPVAHGEGKFYAEDAVLRKLQQKGQIVLRYADETGLPTMAYPHNPNGSLGAVAGLCDSSGRIFGLMPHPERYVENTQHPLWRRHRNPAEPEGLFIFRNAVAYVKNS